MREKIIRVYSYNELSDEAKARARDWQRKNTDIDLQYTVNDFQTIMELFGFQFDEKNGNPTIYYSGFYSQGDGASFFGTWRKPSWGLSRVIEYAPHETKIIARMAEILAIAKGKGGFEFRIIPGGLSHLYSHSYTMLAGENEYSADEETAMLNGFRALADILYGILEEDYDSQNSEDSMAECIIANEYEFRENGEMER